MTPSEAWSLVGEANDLLAQVREAFPCERCDGEGEDYPGHIYHPCYECDGTGHQIPDEEDD
jgi:DnaJ-class molecular chaperone